MKILFSDEGYYTNTSQTMAPSIDGDGNGYYISCGTLYMVVQVMVYKSLY